MKHVSILFALLALPFASVAADKGNAETGKTLHEKHCAGCHVARFGGDGSAVYTRADHKIKNAGQLAKRIAMCNKNTGAQLFPEEELHIGAYLNGQFYKFE